MSNTLENDCKVVLIVNIEFTFGNIEICQTRNVLFL